MKLEQDEFRRVAILSSWVLLTWHPCVLGAERTGEWPMYRHDRRLTGRSDGVGNLSSPEVAWSFDLRGDKWWLEIRHGDEERGVGLDSTTQGKGLDGDLRSAWGMGGAMVDLAGDGALRPRPAYAAKVLKDVPGMQTFAVRMTGSETGYCELIAYDETANQKGPRAVWKSKEFRVFQSPHPVIADANADGQLDVVVCPHYQVAVLDGRTGEVIQELKWHDGRNYGHLIVKNIDDDPALEICVVADFYSHIEMIDNDGKDLCLLWRKEIELKIENKHKIVRPRWDPLQDLDGDGRFELVVNL